MSSLRTVWDSKRSRLIHFLYSVRLVQVQVMCIDSRRDSRGTQIFFEYSPSKGSYITERRSSFCTVCARGYIRNAIMAKKTCLQIYVENIGLTEVPCWPRKEPESIHWTCLIIAGACWVGRSYGQENPMQPWTYFSKPLFLPQKCTSAFLYDNCNHNTIITDSCTLNTNLERLLGPRHRKEITQRVLPLREKLNAHS